jgi:hypothetical protein
VTAAPVRRVAVNIPGHDDPLGRFRGRRRRINVFLTPCGNGSGPDDR